MKRENRSPHSVGGTNERPLWLRNSSFVEVNAVALQTICLEFYAAYKELSSRTGLSSFWTEVHWKRKPGTLVFWRKNTHFYSKNKPFSLSKFFPFSFFAYSFFPSGSTCSDQNSDSFKTSSWQGFFFRKCAKHPLSLHARGIWEDWLFFRKTDSASSVERRTFRSLDIWRCYRYTCYTGHTVHILKVNSTAANI